MKRFAISCLCVAGALALTSCSSSGSSKSAAPTTTAAASEPGTTAAEPPTQTTIAGASALPKACELVTKAQADALMATTMLDGVAVEDPGVNSCTYSGDPNGPTAQLEVYASESAKNIYDDDVSLQHSFADVAGLGDESHEEEFAIFFRKGANWVGLRISSLDEWSTFKPRAEALAKEIAAQI